MKLEPSQIALYIIFIICILLIGYYYSYINNTDGFVDEASSTESETSLTNSQITISPKIRRKEISEV